MIPRTVLLLNASNMESFPVYPYAFIQVSAIARRAGIEVVCWDLLGVPWEGWPQKIQTLLAQHRPAMILITLRNTDSMNSRDYDRESNEDGNAFAYFPIERTKELIAVIRELSDLPITIGGFGFSILPRDIMNYVRPDLGVVGGPDDFFDRFEKILQGAYEGIANLVYYQDGRLFANPRVFYPPFPNAEYTPTAIRQMMDFYTAHPEPGFYGAPLEIMRGCNHTCSFCSEPFVAGRQVRYRDLSAIMRDIDLLARHGVTKLYLISSELNPENNQFVLRLADRIHAFNERQLAECRITWFGANHLLKFNFDEYERLYRSGFTGGWFDVSALDDQNARAIRTPYRNRYVIDYLKIYAQVSRGSFDRRSRGEDKEANVSGRGETTAGENPVRWTMFLGNTATTIATIRHTLQVADREGLPKLFDECHLINSTRIFDYEEPEEETLDVTYSVTTELERIRYREILPSFAFAPALLRHFGSKQAIKEMFWHLELTYLSTKYGETREWSRFVKDNTTPSSIADWLAHLYSAGALRPMDRFGGTDEEQIIATLQPLFLEKDRQSEQQQLDEALASELVDQLLAGCLHTFPNRFWALGLPSTVDELSRATPYKIAAAVYSKFRTEDALIEALTGQSDPSTSQFIRFSIKALLYRFNVQIKPVFRDLFIAPD